jgi:hypothetical protein
MNYEMRIALAVIVILAGVVGWQYFHGPKTAPATKNRSPSDLDLVVEHFGNAVRDIRDAIHNQTKTVAVAAAQAATAAATPPTATPTSDADPAAPAASVAVPPPSAAAAVGPSAGSGGTIQVVVTAADAVAAKHAQLDALIAAGKQAEADKAALAAKQAELEALTK